MDTHHDYIIVGSGAGGSAAAYRLASNGRRVLLLEKGHPLPADGSIMDVEAVIREGRFKSREPWLDKNGSPFEPEEYFNLGGKTKWYGAALVRFAEDEFRSDPAHQCLPWPISFQQLAPYYDEAERLLGVRKFEMEPDLARIVSRLASDGTGWRSEALPLALAPEILEHPAEARRFDAFASTLGLKFDAERALLDPLRGVPGFEICTGQEVTELVGALHAPERLVGVRTQDGRLHRAGTILLAAGAMHSPRILERYLKQAGIADLIEGYRLVGSHYKCHLLTAVLGFSPSRKTDLLRKTVLLLNDRFPHSSVQPLGFDAELIGALMPRAVPRRLGTFLGSLAYGFFLQTEDGSHPENRVIRCADAQGRPGLDYDPERLGPAKKEHLQLVKSLRASLRRAGLVSFSKRIPLSGTAHACGTLVAGNDSATSVVGPTGKVHGIDNLYVVDGSVLPRSSRANPSLTIYAWASRVASLLERRQTGEDMESTDLRGRTNDADAPAPCAIFGRTVQ